MQPRKAGSPHKGWKSSARNAHRDAGRASQIEIERKGSTVHFIMKCDSEYDAMMLYDRMSDEMRDGYVKLEIVTKGSGDDMGRGQVP